MGTISDKLTYLDETRENIRQSINSIGGNLTNSDTFRSYSDAIDEIYEKFPKVEGEGSNITLENTMEASIKSELNGDTSQEGTPTPDSPQPINVVSGGQEVSVVGKNLFDNVLSENITKARCTITYDNGEIVVNATGSDTYFGNVANAGTSWSESLGQLIKVKPSTTYTFSVSNNLFTKNFMVKYNANKVSTETVEFNTNIKTITTDSDTEYVSFRVGYGSSVSGTSYKMNIQFEKGLQATTFEEFKGQSYEINLGKNLLSFNNFETRTINGLTITNNGDGTLILNGTTTNTVSLTLSDIMNKISEGSYTFTRNSTGEVSGGTFTTILYGRNDSPVNIMSETSENARTINISTSYNTYYLYLYVSSGRTFTNYVLKPMLEKGSQATSYSPYKTPIELCKINTYKDMIFRSNGVNLLDTSETTTVKNQNGDDRTGYYCKINKTGRYYLLLNTKNTMYWGISTNITQPTNLKGSTTPTYSTFYDFNAGEYFVIWGTKTDTDLLMFALSSTALPYEPYNSKGKWLLHKEIGKVVLNGSENITSNPNGTNSFYIRPPEIKYGINDKIIILSNNFKGISYNNRITGGDNTIYAEAGLPLALIRNTTFSSVATFKTWLSTHNTIVYYVLATPTTTEITDSELIEQLAEFGDAKSYEGTTNINVDGDLPIILNVKALEDIFSQ